MDWWLKFEAARWPDGFRCPKCGAHPHSVFRKGARKTFQCSACRYQCSLTAGTLFQNSHVPLRLWFLAMYLLSQTKTGLSTLELTRHLGIRYPAAWRLHHKLMQAMCKREARYRLDGAVQIDDAYLGGEHPGGKAGRGSPNKVPFVAAVSLDERQHPRHARFSVVPGFTHAAIRAWADTALAPGCPVLSDGLPAFRSLADTHPHQVVVAAGRKPRDLPVFAWVNTVLGHLKTQLSGTYHAFKFRKYAQRYLSAVAWRFNRRFDLKSVSQRLLIAAVSTGPRPERWLRAAEESC
ncbi:IS1595 family transposase [Acidihalobacter ferrooxydans]|uniref:IS1595 family transposase n=1 Tax=Acidihalobacter ferrooxydans TaxID=1765967 RepID=UPI0009F99D38|nr:IS1595 family transposase [Acidihalobacter ferrooxydans]